VRYLGEDETLVGEIKHNAEAQSQLPKDHPSRVFGETVEAEGVREDSKELDLMKKIKRQKLETERQKLENERQKLEDELAAEKRKLESDMKEIDLRLRATRFEIGANMLRRLSQDAPPAAQQILKGGMADLAQAACALFLADGDVNCSQSESPCFFLERRRQILTERPFSSFTLFQDVAVYSTLASMCISFPNWDLLTWQRASRSHSELHCHFLQSIEGNF
jgi:hypothetical protein